MLNSEEKDTLYCDGGIDVMWLVRYADDRAILQLDGFDCHALNSLVFGVGVACVSEAMDSPSKRASLRRFVHCCCEKGALLSIPFPRA